MWCKISSTMSWSRQGGRSFETKLRFQKDAQQETINIIVYPTYVSFCFMKYMYFHCILYIVEIESYCLIKRGVVMKCTAADQFALLREKKVIESWSMVQILIVFLFRPHYFSSNSKSHQLKISPHFSKNF